MKPAAQPRLRRDKVVLRVEKRLQEALSDAVPDGRVVIWTMTAPIRLPAKTADALEHKIRTLLASRAARPRLSTTLHGNRIRVRIFAGAGAGAKVLGFVHNGDVDPTPLFDAVKIRRSR